MDKFILSYDDKNDILYLKILGHVEEKDLSDLMSTVNKLLEGKPHRHVVADMSESGSFDSKVMTKEMRESYKKFADSMNTDKTAIVGASPTMRMVAKIALSITGKSKATKFFKTKEEALAWLKE